MSRPNQFTTATITCLLALCSLSTSGCYWGLPTLGPSLAPFSIPVPISPYLQKKEEDKFWQKERYDRVPILGPITNGGEIAALDPPSDDEVMRALEKAQPVQGGIPFLHEHNRNNVRIVKEKISDCHYTISLPTTTITTLVLVPFPVIETARLFTISNLATVNCPVGPNCMGTGV